uniref:Uncharacterized protein n=1 Tax=Siphoviridae sp. ctzO58 TaxID=2825748 RepID=A0A8S5UX27_9CAUD|nr:MAG TPA: hypothetical protein [Caudoviricetes sp.]DAF98918.1 MAG TPA: hypothetical protein [Siphoviridae sp. ctzO58]DAM99379.1 MAG TPA: hypothetical protein [Caudoviricetes sp.]
MRFLGRAARGLLRPKKAPFRALRTQSTVFHSFDGKIFIKECLSAVISTVSAVVLGFSARFNRSPGHHVPVVRTHPAAFSGVLYPGVADANFVI